MEMNIAVCGMWCC